MDIGIKKTDKSLYPTKSKSDGFYEIWDEILTEVDFDRVYISMKAMGWKWFINGAMQVPSLWDIKKEVYNKLEKAYKKQMYISGGGIVCDCRDGIVRLTFVLDEYSTLRKELYGDEVDGN